MWKSLFGYLFCLVYFIYLAKMITELVPCSLYLLQNKIWCGRSSMAERPFLKDREVKVQVLPAVSNFFRRESAGSTFGKDLKPDWAFFEARSANKESNRGTEPVRFKSFRLYQIFCADFTIFFLDFLMKLSRILFWWHEQRGYTCSHSEHRS